MHPFAAQISHQPVQLGLGALVRTCSDLNFDLTLLGLGFAALAFFLAVIAFVDIKSALKRLDNVDTRIQGVASRLTGVADKLEAGLEDVTSRLREVTDKLGHIVDSLSTRFVGSFPDHVSTIIELIESSEESVMILADCVDYGSFRDFVLHEKLVSTICNASRRGRKIRYMVLGNEQPMSRANKYRDAELRREDKTFPIKVVTFLTHLRDEGLAEKLGSQYETVWKLAHAEGADWVPSDGSSAMGQLNTLQIKFHRQQYRRLWEAGVDLIPYVLKTSANTDETITGTKDEAPSQELFFWIVGNEGVFVAPNFGEDALAFSSKDASLLGALKRMFLRRCNYLLEHPNEEVRNGNETIGPSQPSAH